MTELGFPESDRRGCGENRVCDSWWRQVMAMMPASGAALFGEDRSDEADTAGLLGKICRTFAPLDLRVESPQQPTAKFHTSMPDL